MSSTETTAEALVGSIERVTFHNPDNGFAVVRLKVKGRTELVSVVGHLPSAAEGEYVEAQGWWVIDKEHGQQFKATTMRTTHPSSPEGIERYLGSGFIKGIGPHFAKELVQRFGEQVFEIIEKKPERLTEVRGIGVARQERITKSWHDQRVVREIMVFLQGHGVGTARAVRIYKTYGDDAIGIVKQNPYRLAYDIKGIGFKTADELAARLGVDRASLQRAQAGVGYALQELTTEGHCAFPEEGLAKKAVELLGIEEAVIRAAIDHEVINKRLVRDRIGEEDCIYLVALYHAETQLANRIRRLAAGKHPLPSIDIEKALGVCPSNRRQRRIRGCIRSRFGPRRGSIGPDPGANG